MSVTPVQARRHQRPSPGPKVHGPFTSTISLGRVAGIEVGVNWTWAGIFALVVWSLASVEFPAMLPGRTWFVYWLMGLVASAAFFGSLILHELGHALQARRDGVRTEGITLWLFGGVAKIAGGFPSAGAELRTAVAGPLVSLGIGATAVAAAALFGGAGAPAVVLAWLGYINLALLGFNLVPALPLDGGRVLRAILWARTGDLTTATLQAARVGAVLATAMIGLGILATLLGALGGVWLALIGWFVLEAGRSERGFVLAHRILGQTPVATLMTEHPVTLEASSTLADAADQIRGTPRHTAYPVMHRGELVGLLLLSSLMSTPRRQWDTISVADCMLLLAGVPEMAPDWSGEQAMEVLASNPIGRAVVMDEFGRLAGILSLTDLARAVAARRAA